MNLFALKNMYEKNKLPKEELDIAMNLILDLNQQIDLDIDAINEELLDKLVIYMNRTHQNKREHFVILMRYFKLNKRQDLFIHLTKYTGGIGVIDQMIKRLTRLKGDEYTKNLLKYYHPPTLGVSPYKLPDYAKDFLAIIEENLLPDEVTKVLQGNNHSIPVEAILPEKVEYENCDTFEQYLKERHNRKVKELENHMNEDKVWFEQVITQEVIDLVKSNQQMLSGVIKGDKLLVTKIPYDSVNFLNAEGEVMKRYYSCHCPFVRESIKEGKNDLNIKFCNCSAGFAKFPFEVILDQKLKVKVIDSCLGKSNLCKFEIDLKNVKYKK